MNCHETFLCKSLQWLPSQSYIQHPSGSPRCPSDVISHHFLSTLHSALATVGSFVHLGMTFLHIFTQYSLTPFLIFFVYKDFPHLTYYVFIYIFLLSFLLTTRRVPGGKIFLCVLYATVFLVPRRICRE